MDAGRAGLTPTPHSPGGFSRRARLVGTLALALLATGAQLHYAASGGGQLPLLVLMALFCNAAAWEAWRARGGTHSLEFATALLFPWLMLFALSSTGNTTGAEEATAPAAAVKLPRHYGANFACWAIIGLVLLIVNGIRLRGLGLATTQQAVGKAMLLFLYPVGFLGIAMNAAYSLCAFVGACLFYRFFKALGGNTCAALALTALSLVGLDGLCMQLQGAESYGFLREFTEGREQASYYGGLYIIAAALLLPAVKVVRHFRSKLGGEQSPLPVLGFLGDILALPALPCALATLLILAVWMLLGTGSAFSL